MKLEKGTFGMFPAGLIKKTGLTSKSQLVLAWVWHHTNTKGTCFPSMKKLAELSGYSRRTVMYALEELEKKGLLSKEHRFKERRQTSNLYTVNTEVNTETGSVIVAPAPGNGCTQN